MTITHYRKLIVGKNIFLMQLPQDSMEWGIEFELATMDADMRLKVDDEISWDGGQTWQYAVGFTRNPGSWGLFPHPDNSKLAIQVGVQSRINDFWGARKLPQNTLKRTTVTVNKSVNAKLNHSFQ